MVLLGTVSAGCTSAVAPSPFQESSATSSSELPQRPSSASCGRCFELVKHQHWVHTHLQHARQRHNGPLTFATAAIIVIVAVIIIII
jgi:hypothetical protein